MNKLVKPLFVFLVFTTILSCSNPSNVGSGHNSADEMDSASSSKHTCTSPGVNSTESATRSTSIKVIGDIENELSLNLDSLEAMEVIDIPKYQVVCQSGAATSENKSFRGVLLKAVLEKAHLKQENHKDRNFYFVARATDNYKATFSWGEIFNSDAGNSIYIVFEENGKPIEEHGQFILICTKDIKTGPRHVYWLNSIEVTKIN